MTHQPPTNLPQQVPPATSGLAIASMICGIVSFFVWIIGSLAAIICGHIALSKIKKSGSQLQGKGMALAGVICGYLTLAIGVTVLTVSIVTPFMMHKQAKERATTDTQNAIEIHRLLKEYERDHGQFPATLSELVDKKYASSISHLQPATAWRQLELLRWSIFQKPRRQPLTASPRLRCGTVHQRLNRASQ